MEMQLHLHLISALDGGLWSVAHPRRIVAGNTGTSRVTGYGRLEKKRKTFASARNSNPGPSSSYHSHHYGVPATG